MANFAVTPTDTTFVVQVGENTAASAASATLSQAWAEGTLPGGAGTKSAKEHAEDARASASAAEALVGPVFASTAAGISGTAGGDFFAVNNAGIVTIYLNDNGVAVAQRNALTATRLASSSGSALVGVIQSGTGAIAETAQDAIRRVVYAAQYGADPAASATVNATAINNAIAEVIDRGGGDVILPSGELFINAQIDVTESNVRLVGQGSDTSHGAGTNMVEKTFIKWAGSAGATMIRFRTPYGPTAQRRYGMGFTNVEVSGESLAAIGIEFDSIAGSNFENLHVRHCTTAQYNLICGETGVDGPAGEALDLQLCRFSRCTFDTRNTGFGVTAAKGYVMDGSINANVSGNRFELLSGLYSDGPAFEIIRADNNTFERCSGFRVAGSGTVYTFDLAGSDSTTNQGAYANLFTQCGWDATNGFRMGTSLLSDSINVRVNMVIAYDEANGGGAPVVGFNSRVTYLSKRGVLSDITRVVVRQAGAGPSDGYTTFESTNRFDDWASGNTFTHSGDGFVRTDLFQNINVLSVLGGYNTDGTRVVGTRKTGWTAATGTATRTTFDTTTVTTAQLAERVKALIDDLIAHGLIGA